MSDYDKRLSLPRDTTVGVDSFQSRLHEDLKSFDSSVGEQTEGNLPWMNIGSDNLYTFSADYHISTTYSKHS
jgi:hypothetical protein